MAALIRFAISVVLISLTLSHAPVGWRFFNSLQSDKSRVHILHDWPTDEGSYMDGYSKAITASEISDVMLQTMGIFRHTLDWQGVQVKSLFKRPRATALFVLDGLSDAVIMESSKSYLVNQQGLHGDLHSDLISMFEGDHVLRYFNSLFDDKGISLLLSGDRETALGISATKSNVDTLTSFNKIDLNQVEYPIPVSINADHATIDVGSDSVPFDLTDQVDLLLFTELAMMMKAVESLSQNDKTSDGIPDVLVLAVSSLQSVRAKYGSNSAQMKAASQLASACVIKMNNKLIDIYNGDIITQLLSLVWEKASNVEEHYDDIDTGPSGICDGVFDLRTADFVACHGTSCRFISCDDKSYQRVRRDEFEETGTNCTTGFCLIKSYSRTENFSAIFGIIAFITIVLIAATFGISWAMWTLDPGKDSIVYQMTSPRVKME